MALGPNATAIASLITRAKDLHFQTWVFCVCPDEEYNLAERLGPFLLTHRGVPRKRLWEELRSREENKTASIFLLSSFFFKYY